MIDGIDDVWKDDGDDDDYNHSIVKMTMVKIMITSNLMSIILLIYSFELRVFNFRIKDKYHDYHVCFKYIIYYVCF